ncbi:MAG TPA: DUF1080 domain-containing protein, partial [Armatimonadota bacterium]|nr:DUF1080 domain-containing protein [Armatimonadota bacterium]
MVRRSLILMTLALSAGPSFTPLCGPARAADTPSARPMGAKVLFDGKDVSQWVKRGGTEPATWKADGDAMTAGGGDIQTRENFQDFQLHLEFMTPHLPDARGQGRGNSGVIIQGRYEIQVLDSYGKAAPGTGDGGAVYNQSA